MCWLSNHFQNHHPVRPISTTETPSLKLATVSLYLTVGLFIILLVCLCFSSVPWLNTISGNQCKMTSNKIQLCSFFQNHQHHSFFSFRSDDDRRLLVCPDRPTYTFLSPVSGCVPYRCPGSTERRGWPGSRQRSPSVRCPPSASAGS